MIHSIWNGFVRLPEYPKLDGNIQADVLIIGGGIAGLLCGYHLKEQGVDAVIIEADRICKGITANTTAKITSQHGLIYDKLIRNFDSETARVYWEANEAALKRLCELGKINACDLERKSHTVYERISTDVLEREVAALQTLQIPYECVSGLPLPFSTAGGIRFLDQAQFHPLKFASGICNGLRIYENTQALDMDGNTVVTNRGKIRAEKIIVATHFPVFNKRGGYFLKMYQQRSYVMALEHGPKLDSMYLDGSGKGFSFRNQGDCLLIGGGSHRTGKQGKGWTELEALAKTSYPQAREICRWANQDCMTLDGMPYIGRYGRGTPDIYVASGFNKWGMTGAMLSAMILEDLILGKQNRFAPFFSPQRRSLRPQLLYNGLESTVNLLTPTRPRCSHLGCALKWNPWEHSWDCPCHGSRFTGDGKRINNPAQKNLGE